MALKSTPLMRFALICLLTGLLTFSLAAQQNTTPKIVSGMVLLESRTAPDNAKILKSLKADWKLAADSASVTDKTLVFSLPGATVMIAWLDYPAPQEDVLLASGISWLWREARQVAPRHQSHVVISVMGKPELALDLYKYFTACAAGVLSQTNSSAVLMNTQYVILDKATYLNSATNLVKQGSLPLYAWVYFGMLPEEGKNSGYTYGLQEFGMKELEIVNAAQPANEVHSVLYDAAAALVQRPVQLKTGMVYDGIPGVPLKIMDVGPSSLIKDETTVRVEF